MNDIHKVMHRSLSEVVNRGEDIGVLGSKVSVRKKKKKLAKQLFKSGVFLLE